MQAEALTHRSRIATSAGSRARRERTRWMRVCAATVGKPASSGGAPPRELVAKHLPTTGRRTLVRRNPCIPPMTCALARTRAKNAGLFLRQIRLDTSAEENGLQSEHVTSGLTLLEFFDADISGRDFAQGKPHPEIFLTGARDLGVPPAECFVVKDAVSGIQAAKAGGMAALGVSRAHDEELLAAAEPDVWMSWSRRWTTSTSKPWPRAAWRTRTPDLTSSGYTLNRDSRYGGRPRGCRGG
jgi:beta-phosphoglucomutase-like phosphatase (HAD superfamily)